jgi:predicted dehydrogenase
MLGVRDIVAYDMRPDRRAAIENSARIRTVSNIQDGWAMEPHAVVIATPPATHLGIALAGAERRIHLFIEKPLANTLDGLQKLQALVSHNRLVALIACNLRFHPGLAMLRDLLRQQSLGRIMSARVNFGYYLPDWHPWEDYRSTYSSQQEAGGGVILDAIHEIDYIRWLLGDITGVFCLAGKLSSLEIDTEDFASLLVKFKTGAIGEVHLDYLQRCYSRRCEVICENGTVRWDYVTGAVSWYLASKNAWQTAMCPLQWETNQMYVDEMAHFLMCLASDERPEQDICEATNALTIALAAKLSAKEHRWVELPN